MIRYRDLLDEKRIGSRFNAERVERDRRNQKAWKVAPKWGNSWLKDKEAVQKLVDAYRAKQNSGIESGT
jgi:hypothetical protein